MLWENFLISERLKFQGFTKLRSNNYFWSTYQEQEIDWVEERNGGIFGYEINWKEAKVKVPTQWAKLYPEATFEEINTKNYANWLTLSFPK